MAIEPKRGCGWRKCGGLYLVSSGIGHSCDRLPYELSVCPTCSQGIHQARGFTWIDVPKLFKGIHTVGPDNALLCDCFMEHHCILCIKPELIGRAGLLWIGGKFYSTPEKFIHEGLSLGFSRRIKALPHGFEIGKTWVLLAHQKSVTCITCQGTGGQVQSRTHDDIIIDYGEDCADCEGSGKRPGIFFVWKPERVERIFNESQRSSEDVENSEKRGITSVFVPDNDPDHHGSVHDDFEQEKKNDN